MYVCMYACMYVYIHSEAASKKTPSASSDAHPKCHDYL
jgi:hypothetical protein